MGTDSVVFPISIVTVLTFVQIAISAESLADGLPVVRFPALPAGKELAIGRAPIPGDCVPIVTLLIVHLVPIPTLLLDHLQNNLERNDLPLVFLTLISEMNDPVSSSALLEEVAQAIVRLIVLIKSIIIEVSIVILAVCVENKGGLFSSKVFVHALAVATVPAREELILIAVSLEIYL